MSLELHLTVAFPPTAEPALRAWRTSRGLHVTTIELARGMAPRQTMLTGPLTGSADDAILDAHAMKRALASLGVEVTRIKLEADAALPSPRALYVEHHVKVRATPQGLAALDSFAADHDAHLSRTPFRAVGSHEERFLTQRFAPHADRTAEECLRALLAELGRISMRVQKVERERVLHDDNLALDAGWTTEVSR